VGDDALCRLLVERHQLPLVDELPHETGLWDDRDVRRVVPLAGALERVVDEIHAPDVAHRNPCRTRERLKLLDEPVGLASPVRPEDLDRPRRDRGRLPAADTSGGPTAHEDGERRGQVLHRTLTRNWSLR